MVALNVRFPPRKEQRVALLVQIQDTGGKRNTDYELPKQMSVWKKAEAGKYMLYYLNALTLLGI